MSELIALGDRVTEDRLYEIAVDEVERNELDKVAMALALEEAEGDEKKSRAFYTKHRVRRIKDAIAQQAVMAAQEELEMAAQEELEMAAQEELEAAERLRAEKEKNKTKAKKKSKRKLDQATESQRKLDQATLEEAKRFDKKWGGLFTSSFLIILFILFILFAVSL